MRAPLNLIPDLDTFASMPPEQTFELIETGQLLDRVRAFWQEGWRLVQIGAAAVLDHLELTYSFDLSGTLVNLRLCLPADQARVPSISSVYWCAFLYENEMHDLFNIQVEGMAVDFHGQLYQTTVKFPFACPPPAGPAAAGSTPQ